MSSLQLHTGQPKNYKSAEYLADFLIDAYIIFMNGCSIKLSSSSQSHLPLPCHMMFHPNCPQLLPYSFHVRPINCSRCYTLKCQSKYFFEGLFIYWFVHSRINQLKQFTFSVVVECLQNYFKQCQPQGVIELYSLI